MHYKSLEESFRELNSNPTGLTEEDASLRLHLYGKNLLEEEGESKLKVLIRQFTSPFVLILMVAGFVALFLGNPKDALVVYGVLVVNGLLGFYQELKAIASIEALKSLTALKVRVLRDGKEKEIDSWELVPGDVVFVGEGNVVPADIRLIESAGLLVDESMLTGESVPVEKEAEGVLQKDTPLHARTNCLYKGTVVVRGKGIGLVFATGKNTELGSIAKRVQEKSPESPLTKALGSFGKKWILALLLLLSILVLVGILQGRDARTIVFFAVAQLVSAVPEGLPIVVTIALVVGAVRLSKEKVLVKYLPAVETLGSATYICSDKTGTITVGKLKVQEYVPYNKIRLFLASALCNDSDGIKGDPLEVALIQWLEGERVNWTALRKAYDRVWEHPFDTKRRLMAVIVSDGSGSFDFYVKGALESLARMCKKECPIEVWQAHDKMAQDGLRVLAFGYAKIEKIPESVEHVRIEIVGLVGFLDPPKEGVKEAVESAQRAGIRIVMITGDNVLTAKSVARIVSIHKEGDLAIEGKDLEKYTDEELYNLLKRVSVIARATPEDKYRVVKVLQSRGEIVAVTGDGANDAPALRVADLGIAMGSGSQAAKEASKMVITDNNLAVIVNAIRRGRLIAKNISKVIRYLLSANSFQIFYNSMAIIAGLPLPLYPTQILWINLVTDGVQDKAYPFTKYEGDPMKEKPKNPAKVFMGKEQFLAVAYNGLLMALMHYLLFVHLLEKYPYQIALTISFTSAVVSQWAVGIQEIGEKPFLKNPIDYVRLNPFVYMGVLLGALLQLLAITLLSEYFHAVYLSTEHLPYILAIPLLTFLGIELRKWFSILKKF
ncbi:MAG: cation-transporting P-type ATPase [Aquificaceae bacterium]|nr:cation-transporting P-type ATPase [Aquificaceae bacterium]MDW8423778.1 cation-transporting P-type ATPase [Aquificaceae bacterium]